MSYRMAQQRAGFTPKGFHQRDEYEDDLDEYEEEASDDEEDVVQEPAKPTKEEQDFLKLREQLKNRIRQKIQKQGTRTSSQLSQSRDLNSVKNNTFVGSFFGPSQPVIASRVIEESRSIRETKHITENMSTSKKRDSTASGGKTENYQQRKQPRVVNEVKNKAQTLKDSRDYSFLFSEDADIPVMKEQPAPRKTSAPKSDGPSAQSSLKRKVPIGNKPASTSSTAIELKKPSSGRPILQKIPVHSKEAPIKRPVPASAQSRKLPTGGSGNRPIKPSGSNALPQKAPTRNVSMNKPVRKAIEEPSLKKNIQSLKPHSSGVKHEVDPRRSAYGLDRQKPIKQPMPSARAQPSKQNFSRGSHVDDARRRPPKRNLSDEEDIDYRSLIRGMFRYNPNKYAGADEDDSDMEADFATIQKEERRSAKIARQEDEEQLRLIEEEEERERRRRMNKKQKRG